MPDHTVPNSAYQPIYKSENSGVPETNRDCQFNNSEECPKPEDNAEDRVDETTNTQPKDRIWSKVDKYVSYIAIILAIVATIIALVSLLLRDKKQKQNFYVSYDIITDGYDKKKDTYLRWTINTDRGGIELSNKTHFLVLKSGVYQINCGIQLEIPSSIKSQVFTLSIDYTYNNILQKSTSNNLDIKEKFVIPFSSSERLQANEKITLKMNMAKYISKTKGSSFLSITSLHIDDDDT